MAAKAIKNLLVTGGAGFIGSSFTELVLREGYRVVVYDLLTYAGSRRNLEKFEKDENFKFVHGDISDQDKVRALLHAEQIGGIINFAAESHVDRSISGPAQFVETNVVGVTKLLSVSREYWEALRGTARGAFRFLQISTDEVFGSLGATGKFTERSRFEPNSPYSASKAAADHFVRAWHHTYGLPTLTTHCSNNYGPRQYPEKLIPRMILCALKNEPLPVYGDGQNVRDWIHVRDHCRGVLLALEKGSPGASYCFGGDAERNNLDLVRSICEILDVLKPRADGKSYREQISFVEDRLGHDKRYAIDGSFAQSELGFKPSMGLNEGLRDTVKWYLENGNWTLGVLERKGKS